LSNHAQRVHLAALTGFQIGRKSGQYFSIAALAAAAPTYSARHDLMLRSLFEVDTRLVVTVHRWCPEIQIIGSGAGKAFAVFF